MKFFQRLRARPFSERGFTARERRQVLAATRNKDVAGVALPLAAKSPAPARAGFTIVEVLITIGLLILVMFGIYGAYSLMIRLTGQSRAQTVGLQLAQEKIEFIRNLPYQSVGVVGAVPAGVVPASESMSRSSVQFTVNTTIRNIDDPFDGDAAGSIPGKPVDTDPVDYKRVEVQITCAACPSGSPIVLTTNVVPRGVEAGASTGSLLVRVINKSGQPVAQAAVGIKNAGVSPTVDFTDTTDVNGKLMVVGMPAASGYRLTIAKPGYSSDGTLPPGDPKNPNPVKPDPTIVAGQITELTFSIDRVSTLVVKTANQACESIGYVSAHVQGQTLIGTNPDVPKTSFELATDSYVGGVATPPANPTVAGSVNDSTNLSNPISVFVSGPYAYVAAYSGNRLTVVNVSNPASPTVTGSVMDATRLGGSSSVFVSGQYAYVTADFGNRLTVVNVSNPASPTVTGSVKDNTNLSRPMSVFVSGQYAYVAAHEGSRLTVVDVLNPASPTVVGSAYDATNLDGPYSVFVSGQYAYVALDYSNRLTVVDISNPLSPTVVGSVSDATNLDNSASVFVSGQYAYVAATIGNRLTVVDVSNPSSPTVVGSINDATNLYGARSVRVSGRYAYVAVSAGNRLTVVDVSNPSSPTVVGSINDATNLNYPVSVFVSGRYAYVAAFDGSRLTVVDLGQWVDTSPISPAVVGSVNDATNLNFPASVFVSGRYAYVAAATGNRLTVVDISNPSSPTVMGSVRDATNLNNPISVFVSGRYAYVAAFSGNRLTVVDVSNLSSPTVTGSVNDDTNLNGAYSVFVSGRYAYVVAQTGNRLTVVDVSNPSSPTVVGSVNDAVNLNTSYSVFVSGRYAYVAAFSGNRLTVVDISNPSSPTVVGSVNDATNLNGAISVFVSGRYAYVAAFFGKRLTVVDISNPSSPTVVGSVRDTTNLSGARSVFVSGRYAYVAAYSGNRLAVVDISNPSSPTVVSSVNDATNLNFPISVFVSGRYAYVGVYTGDRLTVVDLGSYVETPTTAGTWQKVVPNLEADSYSVSLTPLQQYDLAGTIPILPVNLLPNSNQDLTLVLANKTAHSLRVSVRDSATGLPLSDAAVTLQRGPFNQTIQSGAGYFNQTDWSGGPGQDTYGNYTRYWADDGNVDTTGSAAGKIALKKIGGQYPASGTLISSTVDFGESVNPISILWNQSVQFIEGPPPQKFQIATNNDNATWNFLGPDGTANTFYTVGNTSLNAIHNGSRYLRYQVMLKAPPGGVAEGGVGQVVAQAPQEIHDIAVTYAKGCATPGQAFFSDVPTETYNLKIRKDGYQSLTNQVTVQGATSVDVVLSPLQ
ncbi:hypothetical protein HYZ80_00395 [Candidatus Parcubacteria bacterium]|nr:hypothetical protein [Candidatus Parcubacteria bacterium]